MASVRAAVYCLSTLFHRFEFAYCFLQNMFYLRHYLILSSARYWLFIHSLIPTTSALLIVMSLQLFFPLNTRATYCFHNYPVSCVCYISKAQGSIRALSWVWHFSSTSPFHSLSNCFTCCHLCVASQVALVVKTLPANAGDIRDSSLIPGSGRSPGGGHGNPLWYSCLENPYGQRSLVHGVAKSQTWLSD